MLKKLLLLALDNVEFERVFFNTTDPARAYFARYCVRPRLVCLRWLPGADKLIKRFDTADAAYARLRGY